jgi:molybdopterin synthase sulfur carrier subunit
MKVHIPSPLRSYTREKATVEADGETLNALLDDLDRRCPGIRFRMVNEQDAVREHIKIYINQEQTKDLSSLLKPDDEIHILCALSGG